MVNKNTFLYLTAFSKTGGIEQFNKNFLKALHSIDSDAVAVSLHDTKTDERYFPVQRFKGHGGGKIAFLFSLFLHAKQYNKVYIGHINLALAGYILKKRNPSVQLILIAHGIEVWHKQKGLAAWLLKQADAVFAVSNFTKTAMRSNNPFVPEEKVKLLPNALDPFFSFPANFTKPAYLKEKYRLQPTDKIILTIARLSSDEQYKGYDLVIRSLKKIIAQDTTVKYLLVGKADETEAARIRKLIQTEGLSDRVILPGFIPNAELTDHYLLADVFVLPSMGEGFGIVLIEALACGRKVVAGNKDGSVDAILNGKLGVLIDPENPDELVQAIGVTLKGGNATAPDLQSAAKAHFAFPQFEHQLSCLLNQDSLDN